MKKIVTLLLLLPWLGLAQSNDPNKKPVIAVLKFTAQAGSAELAQHALSVQNGVESGFLKSKRFVVVERSQIDQLVGEMKTQEALSESAVAELGKTLGAEYCVIGSLINAGTEELKIRDTKDPNKMKPSGYAGTVNFQIKLVDVATSRLLTAETITLKSHASLGIFGSVGMATPTEALSVAMGKVDDAIKSFIQKQFPISIELLQVLKADAKRNEAETVEILAGQNIGLRKGDRLTVVETSTREVSGRTITTNTPIGELRVEAVTGDETSNCKVMKGGDAIKQRIDKGLKLNCIFAGVNKSWAPQGTR